MRIDLIHWMLSFFAEGNFSIKLLLIDFKHFTWPRNSCIVTRTYSICCWCSKIRFLSLLMTADFLCSFSYKYCLMSQGTLFSRISNCWAMSWCVALFTSHISAISSRWWTNFLESSQMALGTGTGTWIEIVWSGTSSALTSSSQVSFSTAY